MEDNKSMTVKKTVKSGITFGSALAMVISYTSSFFNCESGLVFNLRFLH